MSALKAVCVSKKFDQQSVLNDFSYTLEKGSFEALMGPSGCGKSTFLNMASGLLEVDGGEIFIGAECISAMSDSKAARFRRKHVGIVYQDFNLLEEKTVEENILLPLRLDGVKIDDCVRERLKDLASKLGIADKLSQKPPQLSGGERQRVSFARSLIISPDIVLADEPTGNLDVNAAKSICETLKSLNSSYSCAILLVTHDPVVAATAQRVNFIKDGRIAESFDTNADAGNISRRYLELYGRG